MVKKTILLGICMFALLVPLISALVPWYNLTNFTGEDQLIGMYRVSNDYTSDVFGIVIYLGFFLLLVYLFSGYPTKDAIAAASFITALVGIILLPLNIIAPWLIFLMIIVASGFMVSLFM